MTQGLFAGCTNYGSQTLSDIKIDVESWKKYTLEIKVLFEENILQLSKDIYWNSKVPFNFRVFCESIPKICDTFISDFAIILNDIDNNNITKRTINLMRNIASIAHENEEQSWRTYKEDSCWKEYGEANFRLVEELYSQGRDFLLAYLMLAMRQQEWKIILHIKMKLLWLIITLITVFILVITIKLNRHILAKVI